MTSSLRLQAIAKRFAATAALDRAPLQSPGGELHAPLGENGAVVAL
jgi:ABC-type uncharacterized transport system ATPase subunit